MTKMQQVKTGSVRPVPPPPPEPKYVFILSGGIGAGKTTIVRYLTTDFHFVSGSPADVMKEALARHIALQYNSDNDDGWSAFYQEMLSQDTKVEYRALLQAFGEFFSNRDKEYWADQCVAIADAEYKTMALAGLPGGIVFDSMRRDSEILAVKKRWPNAVHIHLDIRYTRQLTYLTDILGYSAEKAIATLDHSSEHWLDDMDGTPYDAQYVIDANQGSGSVKIQLMGIITLLMGGAKLKEVDNAEDAE